MGTQSNRHKLARNFGLAAALSASACLSSGCEATQVDAPNSTVTVADDYVPGKTVCDPFGGVGPRGEDQGLYAQLYYLEPTQPRYSSTRDYIANGTHLDVNLFFNQLDIPTRAFDLGFVNQNGDPVVNLSGDTLYEYFALQFESEIRLSRLDHAGKYQFAILSDDGAILEVDQGGGPSELVNNDGQTPTRMRCASRTVALTAGSRLPIKLIYNQGPRYHIALMLLWREIPASVDEISDPSALNDPSCNTSGNSRFFDSTQVPSVPQPAYLDMLSRGWKVVSSDNYFLPPQIRGNPCVNGGGG